MIIASNTVLIWSYSTKSGVPRGGELLPRALLATCLLVELEAQTNSKPQEHRVSDFCGVRILNLLHWFWLRKEQHLRHILFISAQFIISAC